MAQQHEIWSPQFADLSRAVRLAVEMRDAQRAYFGSAPQSLARQAALKLARNLERDFDRLTRGWNIPDDQ